MHQSLTIGGVVLISDANASVHTVIRGGMAPISHKSASAHMGTLKGEWPLSVTQDQGEWPLSVAQVHMPTQV